MVGGLGMRNELIADFGFNKNKTKEKNIDEVIGELKK
jgi:hypothetical protein